MNSISSIALHVTAHDEAFIREWYCDFELFADKRIKEVANRVLMRCDQYGFEIEISKLNLDLGNIPEEDFAQDFERILEEKLEESVMREILYPSRKEDKRLEEADYQFEALKQFLLHGTLSWNMAQRFKNILELFRAVLKTKAKEFTSFLKSYGHYTSLQLRMIYQLDDPELFEVVQLLAPAEFSFIRSYIVFLRVKYAETAQHVQMREEERKMAIWSVVYAYLLNNQSAAFNRKLFVKETIGSLAAHINISYGKLLHTLTFFLSQGFSSAIPSGLQLILQELKAEDQTVSMAIRVQKPEEWPHILREIKNPKQHLKLHESDLDQLRSLLENENQVLLVIKPLRETEIFELVRLLVPLDAPFVIKYAQHLNKQNHSGALQGKAGGEFLLFKWQVIFPLLALSKSVPVNKEYLVWQVFKRLSARYNVELWKIVSFAYAEISKWKIQSVLRELIQRLYAELVQGKTKSEQLQTYDSVEFQFRLLTERTRLSREQVAELKSKLSSSLFRELLLDQLNESTRYRLLAIILPSKALELSSFMQLLHHSSNGVRIEGKVIGSIQRLKWSFLFDVLEETKNQVFNQETIVQRVLEKTGAHYNLSLRQLIDYFYLDFRNSNFSLPFNLFKILASIRQKILAGEGKTNDEETAVDLEIRMEHKKHLLQYFTENEQNMPVIHALSLNAEWVKFLIPVLDLLKKMTGFISRKWGTTISEQAIIQLIFSFSKKARHRSQKELLVELWILIRKQLSSRQQVAFFKEFILVNEQEALLLELQHELKKDTDHYPEAADSGKLLAGKEEEEIPEEEMEKARSGSRFINNAGLVLISPFLPRLFSMLELTENGTFKNRDAQIKAIFLMQYAVFGNGEFPEHQMQLNKLLTNFKTGIPIPRRSNLTDEERETVDGMLQGVLQNWGRLANTTNTGLQEGFLCREGSLEEQEESHLLTVETKAFDMLLDYVPWNFRTIRFSWMKKAIQVKWR
ncbi:contractile injection system tape measure protein [Fluviicola sp.]|jgi:hypothetical protein|uniref:contractile injection system tape measure protein n=1 Tax=Fluviicola sp. TaxID=1917219 RepID=UPI00281B66C9|nr:contractile injection system tape measure protein [Fluviicola sp.]MDR0802979.1 hypothetical protein [Fluviicola sp.]